MNKNSDVATWLKLNSQWRDALQKAETFQNQLDVQIKHYFDGLGQKPSMDEVVNTTLGWEAESNVRQKSDSNKFNDSVSPVAI